MLRKTNPGYSYVPKHKPCGLVLMINVDTDNWVALSDALDKFPIGYLFTEKNIYFADLIAGRCMSFPVEPKVFAELISNLRLERPFAELNEKYREDKNNVCMRNAAEMTIQQLRYVSEATKHTLPALTLVDILNDISRNRCSYESWQAYLGDKTRYSDEMLYHFFLGVDVNGIIDAAQKQPSLHDVPAEILAEAKVKITELESKGIKIPETPSKIHDRAYLFGLLEAYERVRVQRPEFETTTSSVASSFYGGLSKTERLQFCDLYKQFITSDYELNQFNVFLKSISVAEKKIRVGFWGFATTMFDLKKTILQGFIKAVHDCARDRGNELARQNTTPLPGQADADKVSLRPGRT